MKILLLIVLIIAITINASVAQTIERQVVASAGTSSTVGNISLEYTVGEAVIISLPSGSISLTQGFHQGSFITTGVTGLPLSVTYRVYPNPAKEQLWLEMTGPELDFYVLMYDELGQTLNLAKRRVAGIGQWKGDFDLSKLQTGLYLLVFTDLTGNWLASQKIIKQ